MSVIYRPHKGTLAESMEEAKLFPNLEECFIYIQEYYTKLYGKCPFNINEISLTSLHADERIGWKDAMLVCVDRMGDEYYSDFPQCVGMCATDFPIPQRDGGDQK